MSLGTIRAFVRYAVYNRPIVRMRARGEQRKAVCFFGSKLTMPEGEGPSSRSRTLAENGHRRAFTPAVILFIALPEEKDNIEPG